MSAKNKNKRYINEYIDAIESRDLNRRITVFDLEKYDGEIGIRLEKTHRKEKDDLNLENTIHFKIDRNIKTTVQFGLTYEGAEILSQLLLETLLKVRDNQKKKPDEK